MHPTNATLIGGLQDNGVVRFNGVATWTTNVLGGDGGPCAIAPNGTTVLASNDARGVRRSTTGIAGAFSTALTAWAFTADDRTAFMAPLGISKSDGNYMYVASDNIHRSTNGGTTWTNTATSSTAYIEQQRKTAISLAVSPITRDKIYVSTSNIAQNTSNDYLWVNGQPNVFKSTTPTTTPYTSIKGTLPDRFVMDFAISKYNDDSVYIAMGGFGSSHIYLSPDGGANWESRSSGLPNVPFNAILIDPVNPKVIYAACDFGVYVSPNRGGTWYDYNTGFTDATYVIDLQVNGAGKLVAATHGKGVYISDLYTPPITLPVTFTSFTGVNKDDINELKWNVEQEFDLDHYELERSLDANSNIFQRVANITAFNTPSPRTYTYNDNVANVFSPAFYYRLKAVNSNGTYFYSDIVFIKSNRKSTFKVFGNPFTSNVSFRYNANASGKMIVQLSDMGGRIIRKEEQSVTTGSGYYTVDNLSALPAGVYILDLWINKDRYTQKIIKR